MEEDEEKGAEEDEDLRLVKVMTELTLVSARMAALVMENEIVETNAERIILSCLVLVKMVKNGLDLSHVKITMESNHANVRIRNKLVMTWMVV